VPALSEATLLGAALVAGIGSNLYDDEKDARSSLLDSPISSYHPNRSHHNHYQHLYQEGFTVLQEPLRAIGKSLNLDPSDVET
jgi:xylulokinase